MKLIERYIFQRAALATLVTLGSLAGVVWVIQALRGIDIITNKGQTLVAYLLLTTLAVPALLQAIVPLALLIACVYAINTLNSNTELVVMNASGASNWVLAKPLIAVGLIGCLVAGYIAHFISPTTRVSVKEQSAEITADLVSVIVREGEFNEIEQGLTFHIARRGEGGVLNGILISDEREETTSILYTAREGLVTQVNGSPLLLLRDGEIHQKDLTDDSVTVIRYQSYGFDLSSFQPSTERKALRPKERNTWDLFNPDPNDLYYQRNPGLFSAQIHERFSEMLWPFAYILVLLAFAGQARSTRQSHASSIWSAITILIIMRGVGFYAASSAKSDIAGAIMLYSLPLLCILVGSFFVFTNRLIELPQGLVNRLDRNQEIMIGSLHSLRRRYIAFRRKLAGIEA